MDIQDLPVADLSEKDIAAVLSQAGNSLKGRNLRKTSWLEIAGFLTAQGRLQSIVWQRLLNATTRDDALRVLRIVRKQARKKSAAGGQRYKAQVTASISSVEETWNPDDEVDEYWNNRDPWYTCAQCDHCGTTIGPEDLLAYGCRRVMNKLLARELAPLIESSKVSPVGGDGTYDAALLLSKESPPPIEVRLAQHLQIPSRQLNDPVFEASLQNAIGNYQNLKVIESIAAESKNSDLAVLLCLFSPFWIRSPKSWDQTKMLVHHLFVQHSVPEYLCSKWSRASTGHLKWVIWFILLGQGVSLRRAAKHFAWRIPAKFQRHLEFVPADLTPLEATVFAEVLRLGGNETDFRRLQRQTGFMVDRTEQTDSRSYDLFWEDTVQWLVANRNAITDEQASHLLAWAYHEYIESENDGIRLQPFSWKGRTAISALRRAVEYQELLAGRQLEQTYLWQIRHQQQLEIKWKARRWNAVFTRADSTSWSFVELTSGKDLSDEGSELKHCVFSYTSRCIAGYSAIFSMQRDGARCITIDVNPATKTVQQARGAGNRSCTAEERNAINVWLRDTVGVNTPASAFGA